VINIYICRYLRKKWFVIPYDFIHNQTWEQSFTTSPPVPFLVSIFIKISGRARNGFFPSVSTSYQSIICFYDRWGTKYQKSICFSCRRKFVREKWSDIATSATFYALLWQIVERDSGTLRCRNRQEHKSAESSSHKVRKVGWLFDMSSNGMGWKKRKLFRPSSNPVIFWDNFAECVFNVFTIKGLVILH
jgi:hypothetical protein